MPARMLLSLILMVQSTWVLALSAEHAHALIKQQTPELLGDGSQLVSVYYFGTSSNFSVVGLERVGEDYLPIRWLVVFKNETVLGWYYPSVEFPVQFQNGHLVFPKGSGIGKVNLIPEPPPSIQINKKMIPFHVPKSLR